MKLDDLRRALRTEPAPQAAPECAGRVQMPVAIADAVAMRRMWFADDVTPLHERTRCKTAHISTRFRASDILELKRRYDLTPAPRAGKSAVMRDHVDALVSAIEAAKCDKEGERE